MNWKAMTVSELALLPEARLGGALLLMFIAALVAFLVPAIGVTLAVIAIYAGGPHSDAIAYLFSWIEGPMNLGTIYMIPVAYFMAWSLLFIVMTMGRMRSTPFVASVGIVLWVALRIGLAFAVQTMASAGAQNAPLVEAFVRAWPFAIAVVAEVMLAAAFCGYMATGRRPNAYYRRRLSVP